jgi:hypothetical protein
MTAWVLIPFLTAYAAGAGVFYTIIRFGCVDDEFNATDHLLCLGAALAWPIMLLAALWPDDAPWPWGHE